MSRLRHLPALSLFALLTAACGPELPEEPLEPFDAGIVIAPHDAGTQEVDAGTPASTTVTVNGAVLGIDALIPSRTLSVVVSGAAPVTTDAQGRFTVSGVTPPYDVTVIDGTRNAAIVYKAVVRPDPTLMVPTVTRERGGIATVAGTLGGGLFPQGTNKYSSLILSSDREAWFGWARDDRSFSVTDVAWPGSATVEARLTALQFELDANRLPSRYLGFASRAMTLSNGGYFGGNELGLLSVTSLSLSGSMRIPTGYAMGGRELWLKFGKGSVLLPDASTSDGFSYVTPNLPEGHAVLVGIARKSSSGSLSYHYKPVEGFAGTGVSLNVRAAPEPLLPAAGATGVDGSMVFSWSTFEQGVHLVSFYPVSGAGPILFVVTRATQTTLPSLGSYGMSLPTGGQYAWSVEGFAPIGSMNEAASVALVQQWRNDFPRDFYWAASSERGFTAK